MFALEAARLVSGDIIFTRDKASSTSWLIRAGTLGNYSHAILYVGHHSFIDSDPEGVHSNNLQRLLFERANDVAVKRLKNPLSPEILETLCAYARGQIGQRYSRTDAAHSALPTTKRNPGGRQFCSRLVAQSYSSVGIQLVTDANFCTPQEIFGSSQLVFVDDVHRLASTDELGLAADHKNPLKRQEEITNSFLAVVRQATGTDVSTLEAVAHLAVLKPEFDGQIARLLSDSGYLTMWEWDLQIAPHWYDPTVFARRVPRDEWAAVAAHMASAQAEALRRHKFNLQNMIALNAQTRSQTVELFILLEQELCELSALRLSVCKIFQ
jgi:hypothetical protein